MHFVTRMRTLSLLLSSFVVAVAAAGTGCSKASDDPAEDGRGGTGGAPSGAGGLPAVAGRGGTGGPWEGVAGAGGNPLPGGEGGHPNEGGGSPGGIAGSAGLGGAGGLSGNPGLAGGRAGAGGCYTSVGVTDWSIVYTSAGCGAATPHPSCIGGLGACAQFACSCEGKLILGCNAFGEPYAYSMNPPSTGQWPEVGTPCDVNGGGGRSGSAVGGAGGH